MERTITVTGQGVSTVVADTAVVRVSVVTTETSVAAAWAGVSSLTDRALATARSLVAENRLEAHQINLWPHRPDAQAPVVYEARRGIVAHCPDLDVAGRLVEALVASVGDALQIDGISIEVGDPAGPMEHARDEAFGDAERKATRLATRAGASLGEVLTIDEGGAGGGIPIMRAMKADSAALVPGESSLEASLRVTWQLI